MADVALGLLIVITLAGAVGAVAFKKVFHNLLSFGLSVVGVAGTVLTLGSEFVAIMQMLVFLGGIAIAMVFAVMMSTPREQAGEPRPFGKVARAVGTAVVFSGALGLLVIRGPFPSPAPAPESAWSGHEIGRLLLTRFELPFEAISILLLAAIIGAVVIARRTREEPEVADG